MRWRGRLSREEVLRAYRISARNIFYLVFYGAAIALTALYVALIVTPDLPLDLNHPTPSAALMALVVPAILSVFAVHTLTSEPKRLTELLAYPFGVRARRDYGLKRIALLYPMALIVLVAPGALLLVGLSVFLWVGPLLMLIFLAIRIVLGAHIRRWMVPTEPPAQSRWKELAPRIEEWCRLFHLPIRGCELAHTHPSGFPVVSIEGWPDRSVFLSDAFLEASDWRQQYAALAIIFGYWQERLSRSQTAVLLIAAQSFLLVAAYWLLGVMPIRENSSLVVLIGDVFARVFVMTFLVSWILNTMVIGYRSPIGTYRADHFAVRLTGDPKAVMAALHTLGALDNLANMTARLQRLNGLRAEAGHRAPWADTPGPSAIPLIIGDEVLTSPLDPAHDDVEPVYPPLAVFDDTKLMTR